jgi:hypothetical protein
MRTLNQTLVMLDSVRAMARSGRRLGAVLVTVGTLFLSGQAHADQKVFTVSATAAKGDHSTIQSAINDCGSSDVCTINLVDANYILKAPLWIEGKANITLVGAIKGGSLPALRFDPTLYAQVPNPDLVQAAKSSATVPKIFTLSWKDISGVDDKTRPNGWLMWPQDGSSSCSKPTVGPMGLCSDTTSKYSSNGFQHNGMIVVKKSRDITIKGLKLVGQTGIVFRNTGIWSGMYDIVHGIVGVNAFQSLRVNVESNEISGFFSAVYLNGRNVGGMFGTANPDDYDVKDIVPLSRFGQVGNHNIQKNYMHDNWWCVYNEINWDMASRIHHNVAYNNINKTFQYDDSSAVKKGSVDPTGEMNNQTGGFMYMKDAVLSTDRVYNNTILRSPVVFGFGGWRAGSQELFYNNVVRMTNEIAGIKPSDWHQLLQFMGVTVWDNSFQLLPAVTYSAKDSLDNIKISDATLTGIYGAGSTCGGGCNFKAAVHYVDQMQPQFVFNGWNAAQGITVQVKGEDLVMNGTPITKIATASGYKGKYFTATNSNGYSDWGVIDKLADQWTGPDVLARNNMFAFKLNTISDSITLAKDSTKRTDSAKYAIAMKTAPKTMLDLAPQWSSPSVVATIKNKAWNQDNFGYADGSLSDRGAFCNDPVSGKTTLGCAPNGVTLGLVDQQIVSIKGLKASIPMIVQQSDVNGASTNGAYSGFKVDSVYYYDAFPFSKLPAPGTASKDESQKAYVSAATGTLAKISNPTWTGTSGDLMNVTLPYAVTNDYARFDVFMSALDANGKKVSVLGVYFYRKLDYQMGVRFCKTKGNLDAATGACKDSVSSARVGDTVFMQNYIMDAKGNALPSQQVSRIYATSSGGMLNVTTGKLDDSAQFLTSMIGSNQSPVSFQKRGNASVTVTGVVGNSSSAIGVMGVGSIKIRPGLPSKVQFVTPSSTSIVACDPSPWDTSATFCNELKALTPNEVDLKVYDKFGNPVDTAATVQVDGGTLVLGKGLDATIVGSNVYLGSAAASVLSGKSNTVSVVTDSTGTATVYVYGDPSTLGPVLWSSGTFPWVKLLGTVVGVPGATVDTARARLLPAAGRVIWDLAYLSKIDTFVNTPVKVKLIVTKDGTNPDPSSSYANSIVKVSALTSAFVTLYKDEAMTTPITDSSVQMTGSIGYVWVASSRATPQDSLVGSLAGIDPTDPKFPVKFNTPPYPSLDSAQFVDTDCDSKADQVKIWLRASGVGGSADLDTNKSRIHSIFIVIGGDTLVIDSTQWSFAAGSNSIVTAPLSGSITKNQNLHTLQGKVRIEYSLLGANKQKGTLVWAGDDSLAGVKANDRVAPKVDSAWFIENTMRDNDSLFVRFTEPVTTPAGWAFSITAKDGTTRVTTAIEDSTFVLDAKNTLGTNTYIVVIKNNRNASNKTDPQVVQYDDSISIDPLKGLADAAGNIGTECAAKVPFVKIIRLPAFDGAIYSDGDALGRANAVVLKFVRPLKAGETLDSAVITFVGFTVGVKLDATSLVKGIDGAHWILKLATPFPAGVTRGLASLSGGALVNILGSSNGASAMVQGVVKDSVPAVLVNAGGNFLGKPFAQLFLGDGKDVIKVKTSEPMICDNSKGGALINVGKGIISDASCKEDLSGAGDGTDWLVTQTTSATNAVVSGDFVAFGPAFSGADKIALTTGDAASKAVVVGGDRKPIAAYYTDSSGTGNAAELTLLFSRPLSHDALVTLTWVKKDGFPTETDTIKVSSVANAGKTTISYNLKALGFFPEGGTGYPLGSSISIGSMKSILVGDDTAYQNSDFPRLDTFAIQDSVQPYIDSAKVAFGSYTSDSTSFDTLWLHFTEPVKVPGDTLKAAGDVIRAISKQVYGGGDAALNPIRVVLLADRQTAYAVFDTSSIHEAPGTGDSIRVAFNGLITDMNGVKAGAKAKYVAVDAGPRKAIVPKVDIVLPNPKGTVPEQKQYEYALHPKAVSPLAKAGSSMIVTALSGDKLRVLSTGTPKDAVSDFSDVEGTIGVSIPSNLASIGKHSMLSVLLYDSYGTFVGKTQADLKPEDFVGAADKTGKFTLLALWDGRASNGQVVNSGVYTMRVLLFKDVTLPDGTAQSKLTFNVLRKIGISR